MKIPAQSQRAFTLVELLVVIAVLVLLVAIQLPVLAGTRANVNRVQCSDNLKRISVAFRTWAENHAGRMPMTTLGRQGGAAEAVGRRANVSNYSANILTVSATTGAWISGGGVFSMFAVMSNELSTPKILYCPSEYRSITAQGSFFGNTISNTVGCFSDNQISYAIGVDAVDTSPSMFLSADANIGDTLTPPTGANIFSDSTSTKKFMSLHTNNTWVAASPGWSDNQHSKQGNVGLADGSVQGFSTSALRNALNNTGDADRAANSGSAVAFVKAGGTAAAGLAINRLQFP